jgi:hypothetical protein
MIDLATVDMSEASAIFEVSNTPLFLLRKLNKIHATRSASEADSVELLNALRTSLAQTPDSIANEVRPYVYLVALSKKQDASALREASQLDASHFGWYRIIAQHLMESAKPLIIHSFTLAPPKPTQQSIFTSGSPISIIQR